MLVCWAGAHNILGICTQFIYEDMWTTEVWYSNLKSFYKKIVKYINYTVMAGQWHNLYNCSPSVD